MNRIIKCLVIFVLIIGFCSSCSNTNNDDAFLDGYATGQQEMFTALFNTTLEKRELLFFDKEWRTDHFSLTISKTKIEDNDGISFYIELNDTSIKDCFEAKKMLFNIYAVSDNQWSAVLEKDLYYDYILFEGLEETAGNSGGGSVRIYDGAEYLSVVIAIGGELYSGIYIL